MIYLEENLACVDAIDIDEIELSNFNKEDITYSILKLNEAEYISGKICKTMSGDVSGFVDSITWNGHKFLDTIRDNKVWKETKNILSKVSSASISFTASVASQVLTNLISQYMELNPVI